MLYASQHSLVSLQAFQPIDMLGLDGPGGVACMWHAALCSVQHGRDRMGEPLTQPQLCCIHLACTHFRAALSLRALPSPPDALARLSFRSDASRWSVRPLAW